MKIRHLVIIISVFVTAVMIFITATASACPCTEALKRSSGYTEEGKKLNELVEKGVGEWRKNAGPNKRPAWNGPDYYIGLEIIDLERVKELSKTRSPIIFATTLEYFQHAVKDKSCPLAELYCLESQLGEDEMVQKTIWVKAWKVRAGVLYNPSARSHALCGQ